MAALKSPQKRSRKGVGGRPSSYRQEYNEKVFKLCLLGAKDKEIADFFDISEATLNNWKIEHPKFLESIKAGKEDADLNVSKSLYKKAIGYTQKTQKAFCYQGEATVVDIEEAVAPDTTSAIFWLKNRHPDKWRDKREVVADVSVEDKSKSDKLDEVLAILRDAG